MQVAEDIRDKDVKLVNSVFNELIRYICELNFGQVDLPKFEFYESEDILLKIDRDLKLKDLGVNFSKDYIKQTYNLSDEDLANNTTGPADFAENLPKKTALIGQNLLELVKQKFDESESLEEFDKKLIDAFIGLDLQREANNFAEEMILNNLKGRSEVLQEVKPYVKQI